MNDNLSQMVQESQTDENVFSEQDLDLPEDDVIQEAQEEQETEVVDEAPNAIGIVTLSSWFEANCNNFPNINQVKVSIRGVNPNKTLIMAVKDPGNETDENGNEKRTLRVFENADTHPVLMLPALSMDVYNNGLKIVHQFTDEIFIKAYGVKTGLICVLCTQYNGMLIPYSVNRIKRKNTEFEVTPPSNINIPQKLSETADLEALQLLYKQSSKAVDELSTNQSVVEWLVERQNNIMDINHLLQIDNVIIEVLK